MIIHWMLIINWELILTLRLHRMKNYNNDNGWLPIAGEFNGEFNGQGYAITGLQIDRAGIGNIGLFEHLDDDAVVSNLKLLEVEITGNGWLGALAGTNRGRITAVTVSGQVTSHERRSGGLVGESIGQNAVIENSHAIDINLDGKAFAGGLVGINLNGATVSQCSATGVINITGDNSNNGGLVGSNNNDSIIEKSYAEVMVNGEGNVGGLAGSNIRGAVIEDSYAIGDVDGYDQDIGGLVGLLNHASEIINSYAVGQVTGEANLGGLVGQDNSGGAAVVDNSYWDTETSGQSDSAGGEGKLTEQMQQKDTFKPDWCF